MRSRGNLWPVWSIVPAPSQLTAGFHPLVRIFAAAIYKQVVAHFKPAAVTHRARQVEQVCFTLLFVANHLPGNEHLGMFIEDV